MFSSGTINNADGIIDGIYNLVIGPGNVSNPGTFVMILFGGMVFGPIVQKYAFNDWWTGFPIGKDLTDNKILFIVILWALAFFLKKKSKWWAFAATVLMLIVYLIPHSAHGSELDYKTGKMKNKYGCSQIAGPSSFIKKTKS